MVTLKAQTLCLTKRQSCQLRGTQADDGNTELGMVTSRVES